MGKGNSYRKFQGQGKRYREVYKGQHQGHKQRGKENLTCLPIGFNLLKTQTDVEQSTLHFHKLNIKKGVQHFGLRRK